MSKDFWTWHRYKSHLNRRNSLPVFKERQIWWCALGANIGREQDGKGNKFQRPVLVLTKIDKETSYILPLTLQHKDGPWYRDIVAKDGVRRTVNLTQLRIIDSRRLLDEITSISASNHIEIQKAVVTFITPQLPFVSSAPPDGGGDGLGKT